MLLRLLAAGRREILLWTVVTVGVVTAADWASGNNISLAALYMIPMMMGAVVLRPIETAGFAILCSYLRSWFDVPGSPADLVLRFVFAALAYFACGMFVTALLRNREQALQHLKSIQTEQGLRREAEEQLRFLAEGSPAAILTVAAEGVILAANDAARRLLMAPDVRTLRGQSIARYLPFLADALRLDSKSVGLRAEAKCQGRRENGELFLAHIWFSKYMTPEGKRLAAIVVDESDEMREREEQELRQLHTGNQIATAAIAHEVRNVCEAMAMLCEDLRRRLKLPHDDALRGLDSLVGGLEAIASYELHSKVPEVEEVRLQELLDNLRIVIEPAWREIEGALKWDIPAGIPLVWAEPHGLQQAFLNLAQNSHRAVHAEPVRELFIAVTHLQGRVCVTFQDSGPGVSSPDNLFRPFQQGAHGVGLGLYVSRFLVRAFGGDLRFEPSPSGSRFIVELDPAL
jgi:signal transduction histidine kinase